MARIHPAKKVIYSPIPGRACGVHLWGKRSDFFGIFLITGFDVPVTVWGIFYIFMVFRGRATQKLEKSEKQRFRENKEPRRYRPPGRLFARPMYGFQQGIWRTRNHRGKSQCPAAQGKYIPRWYLEACGAYHRVLGPIWDRFSVQGQAGFLRQIFVLLRRNILAFCQVLQAARFRRITFEFHRSWALDSFERHRPASTGIGVSFPARNPPEHAHVPRMT